MSASLNAVDLYCACSLSRCMSLEDFDRLFDGLLPLGNTHSVHCFHMNRSNAFVYTTFAFQRHEQWNLDGEEVKG
jgi:hypothetical protein